MPLSTWLRPTNKQDKKAEKGVLAREREGTDERDRGHHRAAAAHAAAATGSSS